MVDFSQVIPFYWAIPIGIILIIVATLYSRIRELYRKFLKKYKRYTEDEAEAKKKEGLFWYLGEGFYFLDIFFVLYAGALIFNFLLNSTTADPSALFDAILGGTNGLVIPVVLLGIMHFVVKIFPYIMAIGNKQEEEAN